MIHRKQDDIEWLEFDLFSNIPELAHGVFLRHGGVSKAPFDSLNAGGLQGDEQQNIHENIKRMMGILGAEHFSKNHFNQNQNVLQFPDQGNQFADCDGLFTLKQGIGLVVTHADCQAVIFYDPVQKALANIHSGWRGNMKYGYKAVIEKMKRLWGTKPQNLLVGISPSLGPNHAQFVNYKVEIPEEFWQFQIKPEYFDLWAIAREQLQQNGVLPHHIEIAQICTFANKHDWFSHRRDKVTGRHATWAMLKNAPL